MPEVLIEPYGVRVEVEPGTTILEALRRGGVEITSLCGGFGLCGKCRVIVTRGADNLSPLSDAEKKHLTSEEVGRGYRLACQAGLTRGLVVVNIPPESRARVGERKAVVEGYMRPIKPNPIVRAYSVRVEKPTLVDQKSDFDRIANALEKEYGVRIRSASLSLLRKIAREARSREWSLKLVLWGGEEALDTVGEEGLYGAAVDIGTSKIVLHILDLEKGKVVMKAFIENPQLPYGEDILSRVSFACRSRENSELMHRLLIESINHLIKRASKIAGLNPDSIYHVAVVGNTVMHHFFLGLDTEFLGRSPYVPVVNRCLHFKARELGLKVNSEAIVTTLPVIGGFVGADAVADVIATGILDSNKPVILVDIGTNTEVFVGDSNRMLVCSAPSGPALEGAHITFGMKAVSGAIESIEIRENGEVEYKVIGGNVKPRGLTGSAVIDAVACLYRNGFINERGRFNRNIRNPRVRRGVHGYEFVIAWASETAIGRDIVVTERDISEIMLAKAAVYTGITMLMRKRGVGVEDISKMLIAGSFGSHINPVNAVTIGMFPPIPPEKVEFVGNTAVTGADATLLSIEALRESEEVVERVHYIELSAENSFSRMFTSALKMPRLDV